jgi:glycosyltransferase involved in cell wall biosynthesis
LPDASIIIPCYNRAKSIGETLLSLASQTMSSEGFEVIVVDDGSTDESASIAKALKFPYPLRVVSQANTGAGAARNLGVQEASAPQIIFLDADMIAAPDLVEQYLTARDLHPQALLVGRQKPWANAYQSSFDRTTRYEWFRDLGSDPFEPAFYHVLSSSMAISQRDFNMLGGFDRLVGTGAQPATDDTDFGYRAKKSGIELVYLPTALAYHNHPRTLAQRCKQEYATALWSARMFERYPEIRGVIPTFEDVQPIKWRTDGRALVARKATRHITALKPCLVLLETGTALLERWSPDSDLLSSAYWAVLGAYRFAGFRAASQSR